MRLLSIAAMGAGVLGAAPARAQFDPASPGAQDEGPKVTLSLIADRGELGAGKTFWLGVRYEIVEGWHVYWNGLNDTGYAPRFTISAPAGFEIGDARWPAPHRHELPGDILDHIYERELTVMVPVRAPTDLEPGAEVTLGVKSDWLVCETLCVPEEGEAELTVRQGGLIPDADAERSFGRARARLAVPAGSERARALGLRVRELPDNTVEIEVPGAQRLAFYPGASCPMIENLIETGAVQGDRMRLSTQDGGEVSGVLEATLSGGGSAFFEIGAERSNEAGPGDRP